MTTSGRTGNAAGQGTTAKRFGVARRLALMSLVLAAFALALFGNAGVGRAEPITTSSDGWTRENFASSCKAAGGRVVEIDSPGIKYSKCYFPDGGVNKCDWIAKTCTFGVRTAPTMDTHIDVSGTVVMAVDSGSGGSRPATGVKTTRATVIVDTSKDRP